jgi:hypothetical protein
MARSSKTTKRAAQSPRAQSRSRAQVPASRPARSQSNAEPSAPAPAAGAGTGSALEQQVIAFAEQLGRIVGTVQARTEGWLDPRVLNEQITRVRDGAASLLQQIGAQSDAETDGGNSPGADRTAARSSNAGRSGGVVDAPGKKHRKPMPDEPLRPTAADSGRVAKMKAVNANRRRGRN